MPRAAIVLSTLILAVAVPPPSLRAQSPDESVIDRLVRASMHAWNVPGVAVAVVRDDRVIYLKGHGVKEVGKRATVTSDTLFPLGSCTKAFTTTALAMLVDEGKLKWDDPVRKHVPFFRLSDPLADSQVTLRDLLCHRTGIGPHDLLWYRAAWSGEEAVRRVGKLPLDKPFRTAFQYQSTMFTAAGLAVGSASGKTWAEFVEKRLFGPLGMKTAGCTTKEFKTDDRATGHRRNGGGAPEALPAWYPCERPEPAGSIHASARDLCQWLRFHLAGGKIGPKRLVSAAALGETHTPQMVLRLEGVDRLLHPDTDQMSYGMGWVIQDYRGHRVVSHAGIIDGFQVQVTLVPKERLGFVVLANLHQTRMNLALGYKLLDHLLGIKAKRRDWDATLLRVMRQKEAESAATLQRRLAARHRDTHPSLSLGAYAGTYEHPAYGSGDFRLEKGKLVWHWSTFTWPLEHFHYDTFALRDDALGLVLLTFALDGAGKVKEVSVGPPFNVTFKKKSNRR
jgi:CubicO group peptidase (beta-lactamase class C family)